MGFDCVTVGINNVDCAVFPMHHDYKTKPSCYMGCCSGAVVSTVGKAVQSLLNTDIATQTVLLLTISYHWPLRMLDVVDASELNGASVLTNHYGSFSRDPQPPTTLTLSAHSVNYGHFVSRFLNRRLPCDIDVCAI